MTAYTGQTVPRTFSPCQPKNTPSEIEYNFTYKSNKPSGVATFPMMPEEKRMS